MSLYVQTEQIHENEGLGSFLANTKRNAIIKGYYEKELNDIALTGFNNFPTTLSGLV